MPFLFSENLIQETIKCFKEEDGLELSPEKANEYLHSFAGLFLAFAETHPAPSSLELGGVVPVDNRDDSRLGVSNT